MRDKIGEHRDDIESICERLLILENKMTILMQKVTWLENPETVPKSPKTAKPKEPEGKL
tara:strand:- start:64 stop:240 length:177 start_codon:yes stop_codon:yes gene_type:complete